MGSGRLDQAKPTILQENPFYYLVRDEHIPCEPKQNIVLKPLALEMLAKHYFEKHHVHIIVCDAFLKMDHLFDAICRFVADFKMRNPGCNQVGFIFISADDPDDIFGHALPMIWECDAN